MFDYEATTALLRSKRSQLPAVELVRLLESTIGRKLTQRSLINIFVRAFHPIPMKVLQDASLWRGLGFGDLSDEDFEALLKPWLTGEITAPGSGS